MPAIQLLDELGLPKDISIADIRQTIQQFEIEKDALLNCTPKVRQQI
nr:hypothetical protein [Streptococcus dysgalactiae]